jgi:hypothetical protein
MFLLDPWVQRDRVPEFPTGVCGWAANGFLCRSRRTRVTAEIIRRRRPANRINHVAIRGDPYFNLNRHHKGDLFDVDGQPRSNHTRGNCNRRIHVSDFHYHASFSYRVSRLHDRAARARMDLFRGRLVSPGHAAPGLSSGGARDECSGCMHHGPTRPGVDVPWRQLVSTWNDAA